VVIYGRDYASDIRHYVMLGAAAAGGLRISAAFPPALLARL
jgi:hypothetical protein